MRSPQGNDAQNDSQNYISSLTQRNNSVVNNKKVNLNRKLTNESPEAQLKYR